VSLKKVKSCQHHVTQDSFYDTKIASDFYKSPEFSLRYNRSLTGADEFHFKDGSVQLYTSYKASLRLSLSFPDLVRVLMALYGNTPAG
jgi:hypothetical protein